MTKDDLPQIEVWKLWESQVLMKLDGKIEWNWSTLGSPFTVWNSLSGREIKCLEADKLQSEQLTWFTFVATSFGLIIPCAFDRERSPHYCMRSHSNLTHNSLQRVQGENLWSFGENEEMHQEYASVFIARTPLRKGNLIYKRQNIWGNIFQQFSISIYYKVWSPNAEGYLFKCFEKILFISHFREGSGKYLVNIHWPWNIPFTALQSETFILKFLMNFRSHEM